VAGRGHDRVPLDVLHRRHPALLAHHRRPVSAGGAGPLIHLTQAPFLVYASYMQQHRHFHLCMQPLMASEACGSPPRDELHTLIPACLHSAPWRSGRLPCLCKAGMTI
jgi:hypothetical protein